MVWKLLSMNMGFSGVTEIFVKPELRLNPSPVKSNFSESWNKTKNSFTDVHQILIFDVHQILMYTRESSMFRWMPYLIYFLFKYEINGMGIVFISILQDVLSKVGTFYIMLCMAEYFSI